jgi:hypothetical protein
LRLETTTQETTGEQRWKKHDFINEIVYGGIWDGWNPSLLLAPITEVGRRQAKQQGCFSY